MKHLLTGCPICGSKIDYDDEKYYWEDLDEE